MQATHFGFFPAERLPCVLHVGKQHGETEGTQLPAQPGRASYPTL